MIYSVHRESFLMTDEQSTSPWQNLDSSPSPPAQLVINLSSKGVSIGLVFFATIVVFVAFGLLFATTFSTEAIASTLDTDGDGILDRDDTFPGDSTEWRDSDFDGKGDNIDLDDDGDGYSDFDESERCLAHTDPLDHRDVPLDTDGDGLCNTIDMDDDGDGFSDEIDMYPMDSTEWLDTDGDGIGNTLDADDDGDGYPDAFDDLPLDPTDWSDLDGDGIGDILDQDDDGDGYDDSIDQFPRDAFEWVDFDEDGDGDNRDLDDDNDGVPDDLDVNDYSDSAFALTLHSFTLLDSLDYWDDYSEIYFCIEVNGENIGCSPTGEEENFISLETDVQVLLDYEFFYDLSEQTSLHEIQIFVWDSDPFFDESVDINLDDDRDEYIFFINSSTASLSQNHAFTASGVGDHDGYDGILEFSYVFKDLRIMNSPQFDWVFDEQAYRLNLDFDYSLYNTFKLYDHSTSSWDDYQRFVTPNEAYVYDLATDLQDLAVANGYTSELEIANFILAFVGGIPYQYDIDGMGVTEYPKYPIEMLWEHAGDCEDAASLYISLVESIGYDAILILLMVKPNENEDWGGHAMPAIHIANYTDGDGVELSDPDKANKMFFFAEATAWYDGNSGVGTNAWYAMDEIHLYDIE